VARRCAHLACRQRRESVGQRAEQRIEVEQPLDVRLAQPDHVRARHADVRLRQETRAMERMSTAPNTSAFSIAAPIVLASTTSSLMKLIRNSLSAAELGVADPLR